MGIILEDNKKYIIEECRHCGNKTKLDIVGDYTQYGDPEIDYQWSKQWLLLKCCTCDEISLGYIYSGEDTVYFDTDTKETCFEDIYGTSYPMETYQGTNVPDAVNDAFLAARKVHYIDNVICLIALRRTLEIICKDKGAKQKTLANKIIELTKKGVFPQILNDASDILRILGNEAAHGENCDYDENIIKEMINFTQIIIEYVYVIPYRIAVIKNKISPKSKTKKAI